MDLHQKLTPDERLFFASLLILSFSAFFLLLFLVRNGYLTQLDHAVLSAFHKIKTPMLDHFFSLVTWLGSLWILLPLYLMTAWFFSGGNPLVERFMGIGFFGTVLSTYAIKYLMERKRPHFYGVINELPLDPSFPSAHTAQVVAFCLLLWLAFSHATTLFTFAAALLLGSVAVLVALSRMYLQVHYPTDVAAGALIALMWGSLAVLIVKPGGSG